LRTELNASASLRNMEANLQSKLNDSTPTVSKASIESDENAAQTVSQLERTTPTTTSDRFAVLETKIKSSADPPPHKHTKEKCKQVKDTDPGKISSEFVAHHSKATVEDIEVGFSKQCCEFVAVFALTSCIK